MDQRNGFSWRQEPYGPKQKEALNGKTIVKCVNNALGVTLD